MASAKESVLTSAGREVGTLKSVDGEMLHLEGHDFWLPVSAIESIEEKSVKLRPDFDYLAGPEAESSKGFMPGITRLAMLGLIARTAYTYRDEGKRKDLVEKAKGIAGKAKTELERAKSELSKAKSKQEGGSASAWPPAPTTLTDISRGATDPGPSTSP